MKKVKFFLMLLLLAVLLPACTRKHYVAGRIEVSRVLMDSVWETKANPRLTALVNAYKVDLESEMNVEIGTAARTLIKGIPQSLLSNLTADVVKNAADKLWGTVDFAIINIGGLRSTLNKGSITIGNIYEVYPFENTLVFLELPGKAVKEFFDFVARKGGTGLSTGIELVVTGDKVTGLNIGGLPWDENKTYRVATLDYLAEGNDGMLAFKQAFRTVNSYITLREVMIAYVKESAINNREIDAKLDNRISINP